MPRHALRTDSGCTTQPSFIRARRADLFSAAAAPSDNLWWYVTSSRPPGSGAIPGGITNALKEFHHETLATDRSHAGRGGPDLRRPACPGAGVVGPPRRQRASHRRSPPASTSVVG